MGKLKLKRGGRHCGEGGRHMIVYFCERASGFQVLCTNLLSFYSNQLPRGLDHDSPASQEVPLSFPLQTHQPLGGIQQWELQRLLEAGEVGLEHVGLGEAVEMVKGSDEGYRRLGARKTRRGCGGGWRRPGRLGEAMEVSGDCKELWARYPQSLLPSSLLRCSVNPWSALGRS